ncbi:M23 family peptidase, partial [Xanthomonas oryzae pv. oryzae]
MALKKFVIKSRQTRAQRAARQFQDVAADRPMVVLGAVLGLGMLIGVGASTA